MCQRNVWSDRAFSSCIYHDWAAMRTARDSEQVTVSSGSVLVMIGGYAGSCDVYQKVGMLQYSDILLHPSLAMADSGEDCSYGKY